MWDDARRPQLLWFGEGKTIVRGGFQQTFFPAGSQFNTNPLSGWATAGSKPISSQLRLEVFRALK